MKNNEIKFKFDFFVEESDYLRNEILNSDNPLECRGFANGALKKVFINLAADTWKELKHETLIEGLTETIIHEHIHVLIGTDLSIPVIEYTIEGEEEVCKYMAGQKIVGLKFSNSEKRNI